MSRAGTSTVAAVGLAGLVIGYLLGGVTYKRYNPCADLPVVAVQGDSVIVRDTVRIEVPAPSKTETVKRDTVRVLILSDSLRHTPTRLEADTVPRLTPDSLLIVPVSRREYKTEDFRAVVEGWRPTLAEIEVYPKTVTVTNTVTRLRRPRFAAVAGLGGGYTGAGVAPFVGVSVGLVLWSR